MKSDKDFGQIGALLDVWPGSSVSLCLWHVKRAIKFKALEKPTKSKISLDEDELYNYVPKNQVDTLMASADRISKVGE
jgi:hypothetical protein